MREATAQYIQEEGRPRGAMPRIKAVLYPFDLDYGLATDNGTYTHTEYGGKSGKLTMQAGYYTSGSWVSPVMQAHTANINRVIPTWIDQAGYMDILVWLRSAAEHAGVAEAAYQVLTSELEYDLSQYFQVKLQFMETIRAWAVDAEEEADAYTAYAVNQTPDNDYESYAVDGSFPGYVEELEFEGQMQLPESEIIDPGDIVVDMALDFSDIRAGNNSLLIDNRQRQWIPGGGNFYLRELPWYRKLLKLYHGFELPNGTVEWQLIYAGKLLRIGSMAHNWQGSHTAVLETADLIMEGLQKEIGVPEEDGTRQPFMRGYYRSRAELTGIEEAYGDNPEYTGSGVATMYIQDGDQYFGREDITYLIQAESTGEIGATTFRWSKDGGQTWEKTGITTVSGADAVSLEHGLSIYWSGGAGNDFVTGDQWEFTAHATVYHYTVHGAPFQAITGVYLDGEEIGRNVSASAENGEISLTGRSGSVEARVVKDNNNHPVDIIEDILTEVKLEEYINSEMFAQARSDTLEYNIGVRFEEISAVQAIQAIVGQCLYDFWVDFGEIKIRAYLGK